MTPMSFSNASLICALACLPACSDAVTRSADTLTTTREGDTLSGTYNPEGFTELKIRDLLKFDCPTQRLATYRETPGPRTLITFTATCAA